MTSLSIKTTWFALSTLFATAPSTTTRAQTCVYNQSDYLLDLSALLGSVYNASSVNGTFAFTPCQDGLQCDASRQDEKTDFMAKLTSTQGQCAKALANFDDELPVYDSTIGTFTFNYTDGTCRVSTVWSCSKGSELEFTSAKQTGNCRFVFELASQYVCDAGKSGGNTPSPGGKSSKDDDGILFGLDLGYVILIGVGLAIVLYCVIGYVIMAQCVNKNDEDIGWCSCKSNIPQFKFWCNLLPRLVCAGCCATKDGCFRCCRKCTGKGDDSGYGAVDDA